MGAPVLSRCNTTSPAQALAGATPAAPPPAKPKARTTDTVERLGPVSCPTIVVGSRVDLALPAPSGVSVRAGGQAERSAAEERAAREHRLAAALQAVVEQTLKQSPGLDPHLVAGHVSWPFAERHLPGLVELFRGASDLGAAQRILGVPPEVVQGVGEAVAALTLKKPVVDQLRAALETGTQPLKVIASDTPMAETASEMLQSETRPAALRTLTTFGLFDESLLDAVREAPAREAALLLQGAAREQLASVGRLRDALLKGRQYDAAFDVLGLAPQVTQDVLAAGPSGLDPADFPFEGVSAANALQQLTIDSIATSRAAGFDPLEWPALSLTKLFMRSAPTALLSELVLPGRAMQREFQVAQRFDALAAAHLTPRSAGTEIRARAVRDAAIDVAKGLAVRLALGAVAADVRSLGGGAAVRVAAELIKSKPAKGVFKHLAFPAREPTQRPRPPADAAGTLARMRDRGYVERTLRDQFPDAEPRVREAFGGLFGHEVRAMTASGGLVARFAEFTAAYGN